MAEQYEVKKRLGFPGAIFYDDGVKVIEKDSEIFIPTEEIDYIDYDKPSLLLGLLSVGSGGYCPGVMSIRLKSEIDGKRQYMLRINPKEAYKLPTFFKIKIGYSDNFNE